MGDVGVMVVVPGEFVAFEFSTVACFFAVVQVVEPACVPHVVKQTIIDNLLYCRRVPWCVVCSWIKILLLQG